MTVLLSALPTSARTAVEEARSPAFGFFQPSGTAAATSCKPLRDRQLHQSSTRARSIRTLQFQSQCLHLLKCAARISSCAQCEQQLSVGVSLLHSLSARITTLSFAPAVLRASTLRLPFCKSQTPLSS